MSAFSGLFSSSHLFVVNLVASMSTFTGSLSRQTQKSLSSSMSTFSGSISKLTKKIFSGSMSAWQAILDAVKSGSPIPAPVVLPTGRMIVSFGLSKNNSSIVSLSSAGSQVFTQSTIAEIVRADDWGKLGQRSMRGQLLVLPSSGGLSSRSYTAVAQGTATIPSSATGANFSIALFQNYFSVPSTGGEISVRSDSLSLATQSLTPGQVDWSIVCKLSGNGRTNGILIGDYTATINGASFKGTLFSSTGLPREPQLQLSIGVTFSGSLNPPEVFQAEMVQFDLIEQ